MTDTLVLCSSALDRLEGWLEAHQFRGYETHDGASTTWLTALLGGGRLPRLAIKRAVMHSPVNLRPLLGIRPHTSPEALGFFARGFLRRAAVGGEKRFLESARRCLTEMVGLASRAWPGLAWGNQFDYASRVFFLPALEPTVVWTAHNGHALLDAWAATQEQVFLDQAKRVCQFIAEGLPRERYGDGECISYIPSGMYAVHNANVLGASLLARAAGPLGRDDWALLARRAMTYTAERQRPDGSWWYGEQANLRWVDNFHTGYVLDSLHVYRSAAGDGSVDTAIQRGFDYFRRTFILDDGRPIYYPGQRWPVDIQCAAQSIETLRLLAGSDSAVLKQADSVARWTITNMQTRDGHFVARRRAGIVWRVPLLHWGQATMHSALAGLVLAHAGDPASAVRV